MTTSDVSLTEDQIRERIRELAPFRHAIDLPYGLNTFESNNPEDGHRDRVSLMKGRWPILLDAIGGSVEGLSILDCACNCGGWSVHAARAGAKRVLGFDVVDRYIEQANFVKTVLADELPQLEFKQMKVEEVSPEKIGTFDVTLFFGILYHLPDPVSAMEKIASVTERALFVATRTAEPLNRWPRRNVEQSLWRTDIRIPTPSEVSTANLWVDKPIWQFMPTRKAVVDLLQYVGFPKVTNVTRNGKPTKMFLALR